MLKIIKREQIAIILNNVITEAEKQMSDTIIDAQDNMRVILTISMRELDNVRVSIT